MHKVSVHNRKTNQIRNELAIKIIRTIYRHVDGCAISKQYRKEVDVETGHLTYGEIQADSFIQILLSLKLQTSERGLLFVDLGCGVGKAVLTTALAGVAYCGSGIEESSSLLLFRKCWGIEIVGM